MEHDVLDELIKHQANTILKRNIAKSALGDVSNYSVVKARCDAIAGAPNMQVDFFRGGETPRKGEAAPVSVLHDSLLL